MTGAVEPIELGDRDHVTFRIHGLPKGAPPRVAIRLVPMGFGAGRTVVVPSRDGRIEVPDVLRGSYWIKVHAIGVGTWPSPWQRCDIDAASDAIDLQLPELVEQRIHLVDESGRPVVGAQVNGILMAGEVFDRFETPLEHYRQGPWLASCLMPWVMTSRGPEVTPLATVLPVAFTDSAGAVRLLAPAHADRFVLRATGRFCEDSFAVHPRFPIAKEPVVITVRAAGAVVVEDPDPMLRTPRFALTEKEWQRACEFGPGPDPWGRGVEGALRKAGCGLWLRKVGSPAEPGPDLERFCAFVANRAPAWNGVPVGRYEVDLVVRETSDDAAVPIRSRVVGEPLGTVDVLAGVQATVRIQLTEEHRKALR